MLGVDLVGSDTQRFGLDEESRRLFPKDAHISGVG